MTLASEIRSLFGTYIANGDRGGVPVNDLLLRHRLCEDKRYPRA